MRRKLVSFFCAFGWAISCAFLFEKSSFRYHHPLLIAAVIATAGLVVLAVGSIFRADFFQYGPKPKHLIVAGAAIAAFGIFFQAALSNASIIILLIALVAGSRYEKRSGVDSETRSTGAARLSVEIAAFGCALVILWSRWTSLLSGDELTSIYVVSSAVCVGAGIGCLGFGLKLAASTRGRQCAVLFALVAAGVLTGNAVRFIGMTLNTAPHLLAPILSTREAYFIFGQMFLLVSVSGLVLAGALFSRGASKSKSSGMIRVISVAVPAAVWWIGRRFGAAGDLWFFYSIVLLTGLALVASDRMIRRDSAWLTGSLVIAAIFVIGSGKISNVWTDIRSQRLNSLMPGASTREWWRERGHDFYSVQIPSRGTMFLRDGILTQAHEGEAKVIPAIAKALSGDAARMLILGDCDGGMIDSALRLGFDVEILGKNVRELESKGFTPNYSPSLHISASSWTRGLIERAERYDVIILDYERPLNSPENARLFNAGFMRLARSKILDSGVVGVWLPMPAFDNDLKNATAIFREAFPNVIAWSYPGAVGVFLLGSASPINLESSRARIQKNLENLNWDLSTDQLLAQSVVWTSWISSGTNTKLNNQAVCPSSGNQFLLRRRFLMTADQLLPAK